MEDALELQEAGVFALLLEAMPSEPAEQIARALKIPVYGIGAGTGVDGQLIIMHDLMGFYAAFRPWFAKCYVPEVSGQFKDYISQIPDIRKNGKEERRDGLLVLAEMAIKAYIEQVRGGTFPGKEYSYSIKSEELAALKISKYWK